jgi:hypothetical protein
MKKRTPSPKRMRLLSGAIALGMILVPATSFASTKADLSVNASANVSTQQKCNLTTIQSRGAEEIIRRLKTLNTLQAKISSATHISSSDAAYLTAEVNAEISGLTALQTKLAADTTCATARADAESIINEYRVYLLVVPKVELIKTADDQQTTDAKLASLSTKLQARITADKNEGKDVTSLQIDLNDMNNQTKNSLTLSSTVEAAVLPLQPSDYNTDHNILEGDYTQLKTAHGDLVTARNDASKIVSGLKSLE